jgi:lysophospholipase L1-like esterase
MRTFPIHTALTIALLCAAFTGVRLMTPAPVPPPVAVRMPDLPKAIKEGPPPLLEDSAGELDHFYAALQDTESKRSGAVTRVVHYGDSPTTADLITGDIRAILQQRFGNAGHGFILPAKPWAWYQHTGAYADGKGWQIRPATQFGKSDGLFGLGGVSLTGTSASSKFKFDGAGYTRFELWYLQQPDGGTLNITIGGEEAQQVEMAGDQGPGFALIETEEPARTVELSVAKGHIRIFGLTAERAGPGVVYDSLGLNGASITVLSHMFNQAHWTAELQHRNPDLIIINYGTNEADFASFIDKNYEKELREAIRRLRAALPTASILVMSPMDRGYRDASGEIATMPTIPQIVAIQRRVAGDTGCGFFDTFRAMGGTGTMGRWYTGQPRLVSADFIHPYPAGGKQIAVAFTREIENGLNRFKMRRNVAVR